MTEITNINSKEYIELVNTYYERYILGDEPMPDSVPTGMRQDTYNSWRRAKKHHVDPNSSESFMVPQEELQKSLDELAPYLEIAEPYLDNIYRFIRGSNYLLHITDSQGRLLKYYADDALISNLFTMVSQLRIGSKRNEAIAGTDSTSLCISLDRAVQVIGPEHYLKHNHRFFCSSAPIHDNHNQLLFILTIMGPVELFQNHTLGMAFSAASSIELALQNQNHLQNLRRGNELLNYTLDSLNTGILVTDHENQILNANDVFLRMFNFTRNSCIGKAFSDIFEIESFPEGIRRFNKNVSSIQCTVRTSYGLSFSTVMSLKVTTNENYDGPLRYFTFMEHQLVNELVNKMTSSSAVFTFDSIIGTSERMQHTKQMAASISDSFSNVLILGESGTGKELFAQSIHNSSHRRDKPFIALNCSSIPKNLIESELFGYDSGAFTGARKGGQPGKFELADHGTLFLDEIGDMPLELQSSLLRVLQTHEIMRLGSTKPIKLDVRIIAATHRDLLQAIENGSFRQDLYYRLNVLNLMLPPLREHPEDIPVLTYAFIDRFAAALGKGKCSISDSAIDILCRYSWPGNVRELENTIERAINIIEGTEITPSHLPLQIVHAADPVLSGQSASQEPSGTIGMIPVSGETGSLPHSPVLQERKRIIYLLQQENGHVASVARHLQIPVSTLYRKLKQYDLRAKDYKKW